MSCGEPLQVFFANPDTDRVPEQNAKNGADGSGQYCCWQLKMALSRQKPRKRHHKFEWNGEKTFPASIRAATPIWPRPLIHVVIISNTLDPPELSEKPRVMWKSLQVLNR